MQRRSPVSLDPNIRGYKAGQVYTSADGVYWTPARLDLDSVLTSIDPGMIQDVVVIPGPYGLRYGPGFSFIDVMRAPTPRYRCPEVHFDTSGDVRTNGGQVYGRETVVGGSSNYGYRFSYGHRRGSDYTAGDGQKIPSSYENRDAWGQFSYDINPNQRVDFAYQRLDQTDTEYPCQFFDVNFLVMDGFQLQLADDDPSAPVDQIHRRRLVQSHPIRGRHEQQQQPPFPGHATRRGRAGPRVAAVRPLFPVRRHPRRAGQRRLPNPNHLRRKR